jgi:polysaccharide export outer membrane protein
MRGPRVRPTGPGRPVYPGRARATLSAAALALLSGCFMAPGMQMDTDAAVRRGRAATRDRNFNVQVVTPMLVQRLLEERAQAAKTQPDPLAREASRYDYTIAPHDVLAVTVWEHPELTTPTGQYRGAEDNGIPVKADGTAFYPYAGLLQVAGKTVSQVREELTERLRSNIKNPQLDVRVAVYRGKRVYVTGMVVQPTTVPVTDIPLRVQDAIAAARGFQPEADWSDVKLTRGAWTYKLDLLALYERGDVSQNWLLVDGDVVNVGDRNGNRVFVLGEVKKQQAKVMTQGRMTLAEALGESEWFIPESANAAKIYVLRGNYSEPLVFHLDAASPDALLLATQFPMQARDVVYVSTYALTRWNRVMTQILPTIQGIWYLLDVTQRYVGPGSPVFP